ncbi:hypothetical protein MFIFM68171_11161 [Madurella fahalii]|uniref:Uncharacterized protein n=1 Tax=Madurella fahalii TaxID=1157608 RepID=A0ABQ0GT78_9PEZI
MGHAESKAVIPQFPAESTAKGLPRRFIAAYKKSWTEIAVTLSDPDSEPAYVVTLDQGWYGNMTMHSGPTVDHQPLAAVKPGGRMRQDFSITLPALPGEGSEGRTEVLRYVVSLRREMFWFAMEVGEGRSRRLEKFEWRRSHGSEVKSLGKGGWGWKLVRVGNDMSESYAGEEIDRADGLTSDGKEVVAVWANITATLTKIGEFEFRGSGATGELGQQWSIMAAVSCMCIWQKSMQTTITTGTAAAVV